MNAAIYNAALYRGLTIVSLIIVAVVSIDTLRGAAHKTTGQDEQETADDKQPQPQLYPEATELIIEATNDFRKGKGLETVSSNAELQDAAEKFARFMARTDKYGHYADGRRPSARAEAAGYDYCVVRENIAYRLDTAGPGANEVGEFFVEGWKDSPEHRHNMLADHITETGVAVASDDGVKFFAVQLFGRPESAKYKIKITNELDNPQNIVFQSEDNKDEMTIPPRVVLSLSRCLPTTLLLEAKTDDEKAIEAADKIMVSSSMDLAIEMDTDGNLSFAKR